MTGIVYLRTKFFEWKEQAAVKRLFYPDPSYREKDLSLLSRYRHQSPYQINRVYGSKAHDYGETPITTMAEIAIQCQIQAGDRVVEMGAGRGRAALFLAEHIGCFVTAYEKIPHFVQKMVASDRLTMICQDMLAADFSKADIIYLYGTMLDDEVICCLAKVFPPLVKIITVSYPLSDYSTHYKTIKSFSGRFPWGTTEVYWNERIS